MPTREQTIEDAIEILESAKYPSGLDALSAWLGIYQALLWYVPVNCCGLVELPHIIDADKLRPSPHARRRAAISPNAWQTRAQAIAVYLAQQLACPIAQLSSMTDRLMKHTDYAGMQRQNTLGIAFPGIVKYLLEKFGNKQILYQTEVDADSVFPGITFPGRSAAPRIDLLAKHSEIPAVIISTKWSVRHERLNDITNECPVYKAAYQRVYRQARRDPRLRYYVVTNEYDPSRLNKMLDDSCVNGVVHVHKAAVVTVCGLNGRLARLMDLSEFIAETASW